MHISGVCVHDLNIFFLLLFSNTVNVSNTHKHHLKISEVHSFMHFVCTMPILESVSPEQLLAATVHRLLDWLSGAPAGLKLNQPLTQALSAFFSYHVHLWILYLGKTSHL